MLYTTATLMRMVQQTLIILFLHKIETQVLNIITLKLIFLYYNTRAQSNDKRFTE